MITVMWIINMIFFPIAGVALLYRWHEDKKEDRKIEQMNFQIYLDKQEKKGNSDESQ